MLNPGTKLGHYTIVAPIGAGGMGEVYRARDERLERDVALKVLPAGALADEATRRRFRKEALALSKLNHPNIETVHDFDTQDGVDFLVMEHIAGETLDAKLRQGPLPEKEVGRLGAQLAEGLAAAHGEGVVHRDLKPGNLRVTPDGRLKILDFGLAKLLRPSVDLGAATTESLTETQGITGTLPYMAPEQLRGEPVDARTDLWAAGAVLYEMATGQRPFQAKLATALIGDIQHKPPQPPSQLNAKISSRLEDIILKCLEKDREHRYQSARELRTDLKRLERGLELGPIPATPREAARLIVRTGEVSIARQGDSLVIDVDHGKKAVHVAVPLKLVMCITATLVLIVLLLVWGLGAGRGKGRAPGADTALPRIESLAVLPLDNLSGDPEQEYFADGMTEVLITELSKIGALKVISRTSAMRYKDSDKSLPEIAQELNVEAVVEGSVLLVGEQVRITAQLVEAATDRHLWADSYDRDVRNVLALHSEVALAIAREIKVTVTPAEEARLARARRVNPEAYELYLKGRYYWNRRTPEALRRGHEYFQQAIERDPGYPLAYAGLADSYIVLAGYGVIRPRDAFPRARAAAMKALEIDDTLADAHSALAIVKLENEQDFLGAEREIKRVIELNPGHARAHKVYAELLSILGRHDEAIAEAKRARELDPLSLIINAVLGLNFYHARQYDQAIEQYRKALEMDPNFVPAHHYLGLAYEQKGMYEEAIAEFEEAAALSEGRAAHIAVLAHAYALIAKRTEALKIVDELKQLSKRRYVPSFDIAVVHAGLGENDQAFEWLEKARLERDYRVLYLKVDPVFDSLRSDPRFQELLRRMGFPE